MTIGHRDGHAYPRSIVISLRVTEEEAAALQAEADRQESSVSDVLRSRVFLTVKPLEVAADGE